jgi:1,4-alpha-glucan branching enzyme
VVTVQDGCAEFWFLRPGANSVYLVGDFNGWQPHDLLMNTTGDGQWQATLRLAAGTYRFRYHADGEWFADYAAFGITYGPYGADSILRIPGRPADRNRRSSDLQPDRLAASMG